MAGLDLNTINGVPESQIKNNTTQKKNDELDKDAFLQLLVTQMQYQDPLAPQDNTEYIAQLAQFTSLEQMTNLNSTLNSIGTLINTINTSMLVGQASSFVGKEVEWKDDEGTAHKGKVESIKILEGQPFLVVGDKLVDIPSITTIGDSAGNSTGETK